MTWLCSLRFSSDVCGFRLRPLRKVQHQKVIDKTLQTVGFERLYTKDSYPEMHNGRTPEQDGLKAEQIVLPDGNSKEVFKAGIDRLSWMIRWLGQVGCGSRWVCLAFRCGMDLAMCGTTKWWSVTRSCSRGPLTTASFRRTAQPMGP